MKTIARGLIIFLILLLFRIGGAEAGLWPFGLPDTPSAVSTVDLDYLYINRMALGDSDREIKLYSQFLRDGMVFVRGRAEADQAALDAVYYSTDAKQSWQKAAFLSNETISFGFRPEPGQTYDLYVKVVDKNLQTNNVDQSHRIITVSDQDIHSLVQTALDALIAAYEAEAPERFMPLVAADYAGGDKLLLETAVRQDFTLFDNIDLQETISGIAVGPRGHVSVTLTYSRFVVSTRSGEPLHDNGMTQLVFETAGEAPKLYSMKNPLLFGVSRAQTVATGTVTAPSDASLLVVTDTGEAVVKPFSEAIDIINGVQPEHPAPADPSPPSM